MSTPGGQVQAALQGGTFAQGPTAAQGVTPPQGFQAPYGAIAFTAQVPQGGTLTVTLTFPSPIPQGAVLKKYQGNAWQDVPGAQLSGSTATYRVQDGGPLDGDGQRNGQVVDPVALLVPNAPTATWMRTYGTLQVEQPTDMVPTADGGYLVTAYWYDLTQSPSSLTARPYLLKLDSAGRLEWSRFAEPNSSPQLNFFPGYAMSASDGGYLIAGTRSPSIYEPDELVLLKVDARGDLVWQRAYVLNSPYLYGVFPTPDGGYMAFGYFEARIGDSWRHDTWLAKLDAQGNLLWQKAIARPELDSVVDEGTAVGDGYVFVGVALTKPGDPSRYVLYYYILKLDRNGEILWDKKFSVPIGSPACSPSWKPRKIVPTPDGGYVILDHCDQPNAFSEGDVLLLRLDGEGNLLWARRYGMEHPVTEVGNDLLLTPDGGYLVAGYRYTPESSTSGWLLKLDAAGNVEWERVYGGPPSPGPYSYDFLFRVFAVDGGYIAFGQTHRFSSWAGTSYNTGDIWVLRLDAQGRIANCSPSVMQGGGSPPTAEVPFEVFAPQDPAYSSWIVSEPDPRIAPSSASYVFHEGFLTETGTQCGE